MSGVGDEDDIIADVTECPTCLTMTEHEILKRVSRGQRVPMYLLSQILMSLFQSGIYSKEMVLSGR